VDAPATEIVGVFPPGISNLSCTCASTGTNTTCAAANGTGGLDQIVTIGAGGTMTYTVTATVDPDASGTLTTTTSVTAPAGVTDPTGSNNTASVAVMVNGSTTIPGVDKNGDGFFDNVGARGGGCDSTGSPLGLAVTAWGFLLIVARRGRRN